MPRLTCRRPIDRRSQCVRPNSPRRHFVPTIDRILAKTVFHAGAFGFRRLERVRLSRNSAKAPRERRYNPMLNGARGGRRQRW
jgi:hypothetical protein